MTLAAGGLRTIWITVRAVNYASKVMDDIIMGTNKMIQVENTAAASTRGMADAAMHMVAAGIMFASLGYILGMQLWNLASSSQEGATQFAALQQNIDNTKNALADTMFEILQATGILNDINAVLNFIQQNKWAQYLVLGIGIALVALLLLVGAGLLLQGAIQGLTIWMGILFPQSLEQTVEASVLADLGLQKMNTSATTLSITIGTALAGFTIFFTLLSALHNPVADAIAILAALAVAFWQLFIAESASMPILGLAGGIAAAGAAALMGQYMATPTYQFGGIVGKTGLAQVERGETITPAGAGGAAGGGETHNWDVDINIDTMHTKSDIDDVSDVMRKQLRRLERSRK